MDKKKMIMLWVIFSVLPIWRSGGKSNLTFWGFIVNHTIFSPEPVEYIPEEDYQREIGRRAEYGKV